MAMIVILMMSGVFVTMLAVRRCPLARAIGLQIDQVAAEKR